MNTFWLKSSAPTLLVIVLAGCAAPSALDDAKQASSLMQQMQAQVDTMTKNEGDAAKRRLDRLQVLQTTVAKIQADADIQREIADAAGMTSRSRLVAIVQGLAASQAERRALLASQLSAYDTARTQLLSNVPSTHAAVTKAVADLAPLEKRPSLFQEAQFAGNYVKTVKTDIAKASAAASAAAASAATAASGATKAAKT